MAKKKERRSVDELLTGSGYEEEYEEFASGGGGSETPFDKTYSILTVTGGPHLEIMTRTTPKLAQALGIGYNLMFNFRSKYVRGRMDSLMRIHVSMGGKGRTEMVAALQSGSGVPGEFYDQDNTSLHSFVDLKGEDDEEE